MEEINTKISGNFKFCLFKNSSFAIYHFATEDGLITVTGPLIDIDMHKKYELNGTYVNHPKYGLQFKVFSYGILLPSKKEEIIKILSSSTFKGIGKKTAIKIYNFLKDDCFNLLKREEILLSLSFLSVKQKNSLREGILNLDNPLNKLNIFLLNCGFTNNDWLNILNTYKQNVLAVIEENPYRLFYEVEGVSFNKIDKYCLTIVDISEDDKRRKCAILFNIVLMHSFRSGDSYILREHLLTKYCKETSFLDGEEILTTNLDNNLFKKEENRIYIYRHYLNEEFIAYYLSHLNLTADVVYLPTIATLLHQLEENEGIVYATKQREAIENFFCYAFTLICGGPGTGKTTLVKALVNLSRQLNSTRSIAVVAATGRASKRINELCDVKASTIHSLLGWDKEKQHFRYNEQNPLLLDILIIDEFSMVDAELFSSLLKACAGVKKICIIGDYNQLPSIGAGNCLKDLLMCSFLPRTNLDVNFRQSKENEIIKGALDIIKGEINPDIYHDNVTFISDSSERIETLENLLISLDRDTFSLEQTQILSPMYAGNYGIDHLNAYLQERYNPFTSKKNEYKFVNRVFRLNDKVIQLKNQPDDNIFNGDIGYIKEIDLTNKCFLIDFNENQVVYSFDNLENLTLAYAISIHKAQGSEYQNVVLFISRYHFAMLDKKILYTAFTRAKKHLYIIGNINLFVKSCAKERPARNTTLTNRLLNYHN